MRARNQLELVAYRQEAGAPVRQSTTREIAHPHKGVPGQVNGAFSSVLTDITALRMR
jgi:hypothetical protein